MLPVQSDQCPQEGRPRWESHRNTTLGLCQRSAPAQCVLVCWCVSITNQQPSLFVCLALLGQETTGDALRKGQLTVLAAEARKHGRWLHLTWDINMGSTSYSGHVTAQGLWALWRCSREHSGSVQGFGFEPLRVQLAGSSPPEIDRYETPN